MEHWRFPLFFAAAIIPITAAQWSTFYDDRFWPQPNIANMSQTNFPMMKQPYEVNDSGSVEIASCEFYIKDNAKAHHTENYELLEEKDPSPILRRGQSFQMAIRFSRPFNMDSNSITVELTLGSKRMKVRGPPVLLPVTSKKKFTHDPSNWDISLSGDQNTSSLLNLQIQIPCTAGVGIWRMKIISKESSDNQPKVHDCNKDIYILFNAWSKGDLVYMEDDIGRKEYVLNDIGNIYSGVSGNPQPKPWNFAQFHRTVLPASVFLLEKSQDLKTPYLDFASRGDPIKVVSAISAMLNNADENGVMVGKWGDSDDYKDGIAPWIWTGSEPILRNYMESGGKPVKYAQCWVFSGVSTTICRSLGLPCRSVTNFSSGTDRDKTLTVDTIKYPDGSHGPNSETEWNFHVWNECWMIRPDLPAEFSGWQAFSGNPEIEDRAGIYRAGPASVEAVKRGETTLLHGTAIFFSAVNADKYFWVLDEKNPDNKMLQWKDTQYIGKLILTKKPLTNIKEDITLTYKQKEAPIQLHLHNRLDIITREGYAVRQNNRIVSFLQTRNEPIGKWYVFSYFDISLPEWKCQESANSLTVAYFCKCKQGTAEERRVYQFARGKLSKSHFDASPSKQIDVSFKLRCIPKIMIGKTFRMIVSVENKSSKKRTITFTLAINSVYYTGTFANKVRRDVGTLILQPSQKRELVFEVDPDEYLDKLVEFSMLRAYAHARVFETNETWAAEDNFQFSRPPLQIEFEDETIKPKLFQPLKISFSFKNPLPFTLEDCVITIEGPGLIEFSKTEMGNLGPGEVLTHLETVTPRRVGSHRIAAVLSSRLLVAILGSMRVNVEKV